MLPDEIILKIFKLLPNYGVVKKRCGCVCKRWNKLSSDPSLWKETSLAGLEVDCVVFQKIITWGIETLHLNYTELKNSLSINLFPVKTKRFCKLKFLDLSCSRLDMYQLEKLLGACTHLRNLSLHCQIINDVICRHIGNNKNLLELDFSYIRGVKAKDISTILKNCKKLKKLNLSHSGFLEETWSVISEHIPSSVQILLMSYNFSIMDAHMQKIISNCPNIIELDVCHCTQLTILTIEEIIAKLLFIEKLHAQRLHKSCTEKVKSLKHLHYKGEHLC